MATTRVALLLCLAAVACARTTRQNATAKADLEEYIATAKLSVNPRYRLTYHVAAPVGWINDPNGFSFYKGQYHLFYQFYPYAAVWGPMHWGHVVSSNLVDWDTLPTALLPEEEMCFSGSAVVDGDELVLIYTGHKDLEVEPFQAQSQYLARSDDGVNFYKYTGNPVIPSAPSGAPDFRDPKAWRHGDHWYVIIGSKTPDERGMVLLYRSTDLLNWEYLNVLGESHGNMGYMWECPDFFELNGKHILLMSPQGMTPVGDRFKNIYQTGYIVGSFDYDTFTFTPEQEFQELDFGHDFYAAQTTEVDGRRYLVAWFNTWEVPHPEEADGWAGALTLVRELHLDSNNRIIMKPVEEMFLLRDGELHQGPFAEDQTIGLGKAAELLVQGDLSQKIDLLFDGVEGGEKVWVRWNPDTGKMIVERENDDIRQVEWVPVDSKVVRIFLDTSSVEVFCGDGETVFSSRVFPLGGWQMTNLSPQSLDIEAFVLRRGVPN